MQHAKVPVSVIQDERLTKSQFFVYVTLASFANNEGQAWPTNSTLAERAHMHKSDVSKALKTLVEAGHIVREGSIWNILSFAESWVIPNESRRLPNRKRSGSVGNNPTAVGNYPTAVGNNPTPIEQTTIRPLTDQETRKRVDADQGQLGLTDANTNLENNAPTTLAKPEPKPSNDRLTKSKIKKLVDDRSYTEGFVLFWETFPVRKGKPEAFKSWLTAILNGANPRDIIQGAARYAAELQQPNAPTPKYPQGWLAAERWNDEPIKTAPRPQYATAAERKHRDFKAAFQQFDDGESDGNGDDNSGPMPRIIDGYEVSDQARFDQGSNGFL